MAKVAVYTSLDRTPRGYNIPDISDRTKNVALLDFEQYQIVKAADSKNILSSDIIIHNSSNLTVAVTCRCFTVTRTLEYYHSIPFIWNIVQGACTASQADFIKLINFFKDNALPKMTVLGYDAHIIHAPISKIHKAREYVLPDYPLEVIQP